jgi:LacI family transcriptional regulator
MNKNIKKVTMYTIADETGLSIAAVSRAFDPHSRLKPDKRQLILDTAHRLGYVPNKMAARLSRPPMRIGVLIYGTIKDFYDGYVDGIRDAHGEYADYKVDCELRVLDRNLYPVSEAYKVLDEFVAAGYDGVIVQGLSYAQDVPRLNRLAEAGIPLILLNSDVAGCRRAGISTVDAEAAGRMAAQLLSIGMKTKCAASGRAAIFRSDGLNITQMQLCESFCRFSADYGIEVSQICDTENRASLAESTTARLLAEDPDIGGIYVSSANCVPVCRWLIEHDLADRIALVVSDVFDAMQSYLMDGTIFSTIHQSPFMQARKAFEAMYYHLADGVEIPKQMLAQPRIVLESNLHFYK